MQASSAVPACRLLLGLNPEILSICIHLITFSNVSGAGSTGGGANRPCPESWRLLAAADEPRLRHPDRRAGLVVAGIAMRDDGREPVEAAAQRRALSRERRTSLRPASCRVRFAWEPAASLVRQAYSLTALWHRASGRRHGQSKRLPLGKQICLPANRKRRSSPDRASRRRHSQKERLPL